MVDHMNLATLDLEVLKKRENVYREELKQRIIEFERIASEKDKSEEPFYFTDYTGKKGCGCKIPRDVLNTYLQTTNYNWKKGAKLNDGNVGIGLDSAILPVRSCPNIKCVQSTDFFYPIVDDPYMMGLVTVSNVLSDVYATGVTQSDSMLMLLGIAKKLLEKDEKFKTKIITEFITGFKRGCEYGNVSVNGGQTVECPWMLIGGVGTAIVPIESLSLLNEAKPTDVLVLTKPLGVRPIVNAHQWIHSDPERINEYGLNTKMIRKAYLQACYSMSRHNLIAARLLKEFNAHASTDVTGFGILGHADNLAKAQKDKVIFKLNNLPILPYSSVISKSFTDKNGFKLFDGTAAETSGGLLISFKKNDAEKYIEKLKEFGILAYVVGYVIESDNDENRAIMDKNCQFFDALGTTDTFDDNCLD